MDVRNSRTCYKEALERKKGKDEREANEKKKLAIC